ncbi:hypothetical protein [Undibacterium sp. CY21W]|uniref:hypothetical protein n=1 Tax=Undibacterium sp. CY21W TaxID=2762293 RepID=UPI00164B158F|nr:hypothetical protein [Undibacterium sp. CY21W]MBC3928098.1 hypothetical protein [Undibacterium sp. CY21W]
MKTSEVIQAASEHLNQFPGHIFDVLTVTKPVSPDAAVNLAKVISKLSPLLGNMIEINTCELLNEQAEFKSLGNWKRQDPGFPDIILDGEVKPTPGFEIKAWFPLATEITGRFKDSQNHFLDDRTYVALIAWLPEFLIFGKPKIISVAVVSGATVAKTRDGKYHKPPDYLVLEPQDTKKRAKNLQQTNTAGYKWQPNDDPAIEAANLKEAQKMLASWGDDGKNYSPSPEYQQKLKTMMGKFNYRLDTNFAKLDRVGHHNVEEFAKSVYAMEYHGMTIGQWNTLLASGNVSAIKAALAEKFGIVDIDAEKALLK